VKECPSGVVKKKILFVKLDDLKFVLMQLKVPLTFRLWERLNELVKVSLLSHCFWEMKRNGCVLDIDCKRSGIGCIWFTSVLRQIYVTCYVK
jgi:hypothetical protein